jgi:hypothetical protein
MTQASLSFSLGAADFAAASDADFLAAIAWERSVDANLRAAAATGDASAFASQCQQRLKQTLKDSSTSYTATVLWSSPAFPNDASLIPVLEDAAGVVTQPAKKSRRPLNKTTRTIAQRVEALVYELTSDSRLAEVPSDAFALAASLELLVSVGVRLRPQQFWRLWRHTLVQAIRWAQDLESELDPTVPSDIELIERGEIPYIAGLVFQGVAGASSLLKLGRKNIGRELTANTDTDGTPHAELVERLPLWLAPLIRVTRAARAFDASLWTRDQDDVLRSLVERSIPLCRPDGRAALSNGLKLKPLPVLVAAAETCGLPEMGSVGTYLRSVHRVTSGKSPARARADGVMSMPSNQSDFARFALLRSDWSVQADSVALAHHRQYPQLDVTTAGRPLIHGDWTLKLTIGGDPVELADEWSCVCWQSDPDADYIELQMQGPGKLRVERIVMLSRTRKFLLLADSISGVPHKRIEYESQLPLAENLEGRIQMPTREIQLTAKGFRAKAYPLALPQDRVLSTPHDFTMQDGQLTLTQLAEGEGLFAPVILDWDAGRSRGQAEWRSLTVTEDGRVVRPDIAAGHRLKVDGLHLLVFRSLKNTGCSRAVLGHHSWNETVIASIDKNGDVDPILMVES